MRVGPRVGRDAHRRLDLVEAERDGDGGIGRELKRVVLGIGDMRLVAGRPTLSHLRIGEGDLQRRHLRDDRDQLGGRHAARQPFECLARHVDVDQHARDLDGIHRHRFVDHVEVEVMRGDEGIEDVEIGLGLAVDFDHAAVLDARRRRRIPRAVERREAGLRILDGELVVTQRPRVPLVEAAPARCRGHRSPPVPARCSRVVLRTIAATQAG